MRFDPNFSSSVISGIEQSDAAFQAAEQQLSTGLRVNQASDDPAAAAALTFNETESATVDQYTANSDSTLSQSQTAYSALSSVVSLLTKAITLATSGANGETTASQRQTLSTEVQGVLSSVVTAANVTFEGSSVFGGNSSATTAFVVNAGSPTGYTYQGNSQANTVQVGSSLTVQTNIPGSTIFTQSGSNVLGSLTQLVNALSSGTSADISAASAAVTSALNYVSAQQGDYGNTISTLNSQESYLSQEKVTLSSQQSSLVDIDSSTAIENVDAAQIQNSAVLAAASKILPESLLNYLR